MATEAQISANRRNAQKSTGPKTASGKAKAGQNSLKHGLFAQKNVVITENQAQFDQLREELLTALAPEGVMETILTERIVSLTWRLKRTQRMQDELIDYRIMYEINDCLPRLTKSLLTGEPEKSSEKYDEVALGYVAERDFTHDRVLERLSLYERRFELSLFKTMKELDKLQSLRKAEQAEAKFHTIHEPSPSLRDEAATRDNYEKQSQSFDTNQEEFDQDEYELTPFEKREHELLLGHLKRKNKPNSEPANTHRLKTRRY